MQQFLSDFYNYISEHTPPIKNDPAYQQALQTYMELEEAVKEKTGEDLLDRYQCAEAEVFHRRDIAVFAQTLRFGHGFMLEVLGC